VRESLINGKLQLEESWGRWVLKQSPKRRDTSRGSGIGHCPYEHTFLTR
jgi:hypothetical protein